MSLKGIVKLVTNSVFRTKFPMRAVGDDAPGFSAMDHQGNPIALANLRGRFVVLWFFPKADTPG
ncbi:MAG: redoxin domain-containing protein [Acidobacteria bacterium]|nr:redoxin domain-containing protein [Acidobacteriota bacterium]